MWNPDLDVDAHLAEFYETFFGPASEPMARYWNIIFKAWEETICTEHEFFVAPAIYTDELIEMLRKEMASAEKAMRAVAAKKEPDRNEKLYLERILFTRNSFDVIDQYMGMVRAATRNCDYEKAAALGKQSLVTRQKLGDMNEIFISTKMGERGPAWFPGEVAMYEDLAAYTGGDKGELIMKLPLEWAFLRDPNDSGLPRGVAYKPADLVYWTQHGAKYTGFSRKDYPIMEWEVLRTDLYPQAQGVLHPDGQSYTGYSWYKTEIKLNKEQLRAKINIHFPGLFARAWLYVNGRLIKYRAQEDMWWWNEYSFKFDVDITEHLKLGRNDITLRNYNNHHVSGMFRRPFLYRIKNK